MADTASYPESRWKIEVTVGDETGLSFALPDGVDLIAGRSGECPLCFSSLTISRQHCLFRVTPSGPEIEDLGAKKPALINGTVIPSGQKAKLRHGDRICIGGKKGVEVVIIDTAADRAPVKAVGNDETQCNAADNETAPGTEAALLHGPEHDDTRFTTGGATAHEIDSDATAFMDPDKTVFLDPDGASSFNPGAEAEAENGLSQDAATGYLPLEEVKEILDGSGWKKKRLLLFAAIGTAAVFLLSFMGGGEKGNQSTVEHKLYKGSFFTCEMPSSWTVGSKGSVVTMRRRGSFLSTEGMALLLFSNEKCRWWTYERNFQEMAGLIAQQIPFMKEYKWMPVIQSNQSQLQLYRLYDAAPPYVVFEGFDTQSNRVALARFYLGGDSAVLTVTWPANEAAKQSLKIWKGLDVQKVPFDIDRRIVISEKELEKLNFSNITNRLAEAEKWYAKADIAPGNTWQAYKILHSVHSWFSAQSVSKPEWASVREKTWSFSCEVVNRLNTVVTELQREVTTALLAGDNAKVKYFASMIQQEIPDNEDYRWVWAEKQKNALKK